MPIANSTNAESNACCFRTSVFHALQVAAVLACCCAIRIYLVSRTATIAPDGVVYINVARHWSQDPLAAARENTIHVGYPAAIAGAHSVLTAVGVKDGLRTWELAGQGVSLAAGIAALGGLWCFTIMVFPRRAGGAPCNWPVAWVTILLFG
ncbi:MAG: hypothetical protein J7M14_04035, partial [Planctomycetes bacterium]|nr:hypothetical protein [Planctomycetota bacterium]